MNKAMEVELGRTRKGLVCFYEAFGTMLLMCAFNWESNDRRGLAGPIVIFAVTLLFSSISGGHFNPAVTMGVLMSGGQIKYDGAFAFLIMFCQTVGATIGVLVARLGIVLDLDEVIDGNA